MKKTIKLLLCLLSFGLIISCTDTKFYSQDGLSMDKQFIPRKVIFGNPDKVNVKISPDGKYISYVAPLEGVLNVFVTFAVDVKLAKPVTHDKGRGISAYTWTMLPNKMIYAQDTDGDENTILYLLDLATLESKAITPKKVKAIVANISMNHPDEILISMNERNQSYFDIYKLNLKTGDKQLLFKNDEYIDITIDDNNDIRFLTKVLSDGRYQIDQLTAGGLEPFKTIKFEDTDTTDLLGLNRDATKLFMKDSSGIDKVALYEIELATNTKTLIAKSDKADISGVYFDPKTYEVQGYEYDYTKPVINIIDFKIKDDFKYLESINDGQLNITSRDDDDKTWIVAYVKADASISYYKYDRAAKKAEFLFYQRDELNKYQLNPMHATVIKARDGLDMVSYLSLPKKYVSNDDGVKPTKPLPMVLVVHGGPNARDVWGYNPTHQWLTDRGFAVLSVNYRGSTGFGKKFVRAGDGEWAGKMHDDLIDAVNWAVEQGITTKDGVAIFGGSYGGYATLVGLTQTPDIFICGVDIVGPSSLKTLYDSMPPYWLPLKESLKRKFGADPDTVEGMKIINAKSPINYATNIKKPLLIAQGANDPRVKQAESDQIVDLLIKKNIPVTYLLFPNEGHGFARPENRSAFYAKAEEFLGNCFKVPYEQPTAEELEESSMILVHDTTKIQNNE